MICWKTNYSEEESRLQTYLISYEEFCKPRFATLLVSKLDTYMAVLVV